MNTDDIGNITKRHFPNGFQTVFTYYSSCLYRIKNVIWFMRRLVNSDSYPVVTYLFLLHWNMGRRLLRPSLDAPRTHQILPINHSADKRSDWVRVRGKLVTSQMPSSSFYVLLVVLQEVICINCLLIS